LSRKRVVENRRQFLRGSILGILVVLIKFIFFLPIDIADILYGSVLLASLVITMGEIFELKYFVLEDKYLDFVLGFLFPLDCYAVIILFGVPLTN